MNYYEEEGETIDKKLIDGVIEEQQMKRDVKIRLFVYFLFASICSIVIILFSTGQISVGLTLIYILTMMLCIFGLYVKYLSSNKSEDT